MLGAYTTFSTFVYETARLVQHGKLLVAATYVIASLALGLVAAWMGAATARSILNPG
jgi:CrcB protein